MEPIVARQAVGGESNITENSPHVLVVDDSLTVRMDLVETFESAGFPVTSCSTLQDARAAIERERFCLVVLDVLLPDGDGLDLLRELKRSAPEVPVMLLSTEAEVKDRIRGLKTGADDYVGKPYERRYVLARARALVKVRERKPAAPGILIIDDSVTFREQFKATLEAAGYRVFTAATGEEGLNAAFVHRPDAVIVDRMLGEGMDGDTVIGRLKQDVMLRTTPCLLLTESSGPGEELPALEKGADVYLSKQTDVNVILARISGLLRSASAARIVDSSASSLLGAKRVLAVDDSPTFLSEVSAQMRQEGYSVAAAASGQEALELLEVQAVDCILLDVRMPKLSGFEVCRMIKQRPELSAIPLLLVTAAEEPEGVIEGINSGADDYVCKSSDFVVLKARVRAQLRRRQLEEEYRRTREELHATELETARARAAQEIAASRAAMVDELEKKNRELEAFTYSASHDLRAPLRTVLGFTKAVLEDFPELPAQAREQLGRVQAAAGRMGTLIDALLELSRTSRASLNREAVDLSKLAGSLAAELSDSDRSRKVEWHIAEGLVTNADPALTRVVLNNLLSNAWKFTSKMARARIEFGAVVKDDKLVYFVKDNGVGFNSASAKRLFQPFERFHATGDFAGAGIGLATVRRIIERHRGEIWAESLPGQGASFFFRLEAAPKLSHGKPRSVETSLAPFAP